MTPRVYTMFSSPMLTVDHPCRLNTSGSADTDPRHHVSDDTTEQTLELGVDTIRFGVYISRQCWICCKVTLTIVVGSLFWSLQFHVCSWSLSYRMLISGGSSESLPLVRLTFWTWG